MPPTVPASYNRPVEGQPEKWSASDECRSADSGKAASIGPKWPQMMPSITFGLAQGKPILLMYIASNAPHDPRQAPLAFQEMYPLDRIAVPSNYLDQYPYKDANGCGPDLRDE